MSDDIARKLSLLLADDIEGVVDALGIDVRQRGRRQLVCFAPWNNHHKPKLEINLHRRRGGWNDWHGGVWGDALGLVACTLSGQPDPKAADALREAIRWAQARYGIAGAVEPEAWKEKVAAAERRAKVREGQAARELAEARKQMFGVWLRFSEPLRPTTRTHKGCFGARYLEARGVDFGLLPHLPRAVRLSGSQQWRGRDGETHVGPALMSAMTLPDGKFGSLHRIWIDPFRDGEKADINPPRKMYPSSEGAAIRLWRGASRLSMADAAEKGIKEGVVVAEGVEDGLSVAMMTPELRVDAAGSLPGLLSYVPPPCASHLVIAADNDWGKPQAQALLDRAVARLRTEFKMPVGIARSPEGKDFNDLVKE